jgi:glycosyltransferase involved in cell wall biosynthesis
MTGAEPACSVIMSAYNSERFLQSSLESILSQSFSDFEFIIINDGSTDTSGKILDACRDSRVIIIHQSNSGLSASLNRGISVARGRYIARMDADDISLPDRLQTQLDFMETNPRVGLLSCCFYEIDAQGKQGNLCCLPSGDAEIRDALMLCNQFCHGAAFFRRQCVERVGGYRACFEFSQDYDLWLRIAEAFECANIEQPLYQWRVTDTADDDAYISKITRQCYYAAFALVLARERKSSGKDRAQKHPAQVWDVRGEITGRDRFGILTYILLATAIAFFRRKKPRLAHALAKEAFRANPLSLKAISLLAKTAFRANRGTAI